MPIKMSDYTKDDFDTPLMYDSFIEGQEQKEREDWYSGCFYRENGCWYFELEGGEFTNITPALPENIGGLEIIS